jgi:hypothetical protein
MPTVVDVKVFPVSIVEATKLTFVCSSIKLRKSLARQKYHSFENLHQFHSLACSVLTSVSSKYVFSSIILVALGCQDWAKLNKHALCNIFIRKGKVDSECRIFREKWTKEYFCV